MQTPLVRAAAALAEAPAGILTDLDGTLAPIVNDPATARPSPGAIDTLTALGRHLAVVGIVSGRSAADVRRIVGSDRLLVVGNHGLEWLAPGAREPEAPDGAEGLGEAVEAALRAVPREPCVTIERKGLSATVHVRGCPDPAAARERVRAALVSAAPAGIEVRSGRMSLEIRPMGAGDKGTALRAVAQRYRLRGLLVLGDDVTDVDMFHAAAELRAAGRLRTASLAVHGGREVPAEVTASADAVLDSPAAVVELLAGLLDEVAAGD
jgi:trehalose 6-phosphate phosphatase